MQSSVVSVVVDLVERLAAAEFFRKLFLGRWRPESAGAGAHPLRVRSSVKAEETRFVAQQTNKCHNAVEEVKTLS